MTPTSTARARFVATVAALFTCGAVLIANSSTAAAATPAVAAVSTIQSVSQRTCLDIAAAAPGSNFLDTYGHRCSTSITQQFAFHPLPGVNTYEITNQSSGKCIDQYRFGIRQQTCTGSVPPDYTNVQWTLEQVGTTGHQYRFEVTTTAATSSPRCIQVHPKPNGYPGPTFTLTACNTAAPDQILTLTRAP